MSPSQYANGVRTDTVVEQRQSPRQPAALGTTATLVTTSDEFIVDVIDESDGGLRVSLPGSTSVGIEAAVTVELRGDRRQAIIRHKTYRQCGDLTAGLSWED